MVSLTVLMLSVLGAAYYTKRENAAKKQEKQKWERLYREKEEDRRTKEEALKARGEAAQRPREASVEASAEDKLAARGLGREQVAKQVQRGQLELWRLNG